MAKSRPNDEEFASLCWQHDTPTVQRLFEVAQAKLNELGRDFRRASLFPRAEMPLGSFNEAGWKEWIEGVEPDNLEDATTLEQFVATCRVRLGFEAGPGLPSGAAGATESTDTPDIDTDIHLIERRNSGLYGVIFEGRQRRLGRKVAVKIIRQSMANVASAREHARALARLQHENVVTVYQLASVRDPESGQVMDAVVMEWLEGETIGARIAGRAFSIDEAKAICWALVRGVKHIHAQKLTHGDLHAGNVVITDEMVKIIDVNYTEAQSLAILSSNSRATNIQADIDSLGYLIRRVTLHSRVDAQRFGDCDGRLHDATSVEQVESILADLFSSEHGVEGDVDDSGTEESPLAKLCSLGLERSDALVLQAAGAKVLNGKHNADVVSVPALIEEVEELGVTHSEVEDAVEVLYKKGLIRADGRYSRFFQLSAAGFDGYLRCFYESYVDDFERVCSAIVNDDLKNDRDLVERLQLPRPFVLNALDVLEMNNLCNVSRTNSGSTITHVSVELRRKAVAR